MFDAHCHLDRASDPTESLARARAAGIEHMVVAGVDPAGWAAQRQLQLRGVSHAIGLHPWAVAAMDNEAVEHALNTLPQSLSQSGVVALGETGLDHGRKIDPTSHHRQEHAFRFQLGLAREMDLPVVLHVVRSHQRVLEILRQEQLPSAGGMVHAWSGHPQMVEPFTDLGLHLSFCGTVVDPKRLRPRDSVPLTPEKLLLVETDAPDQTPVSRMPGPNEPAYLIDVISAVAELRGSSPEQIAHCTAVNAANLFRVDQDA